jgi:creatinine amidohydrolase
VKAPPSSRAAARDRRLGDLTTTTFAALRASGRPLVALVPVGSVEPHGPHLPLATDTIISEAACVRAAEQLERHGVEALVAPPLPYGVTDFAEGFAGAVSLPAASLTATLRALLAALLKTGFDHVALVNNHLEPAHDAAVRAALEGLSPARVSVACPLTRRWARTLSEEFKSGKCHAGRYETSLVLASRPDLVDRDAAAALPAVDVSLSEGIRAGKATFRAMGMPDAYAGAPGDASAHHGEEQLGLLADMIEAEVAEALGKA